MAVVRVLSAAKCLENDDDTDEDLKDEDEAFPVDAIDHVDIATARSNEKMFQTFLDHWWDINSKTDMGAPALR